MKLVLRNSEDEVIKEMPLGKETNFEHVTASPEVLAEWLDNTFDYCQAMWYWRCDKCTWSKKNESCVGDKEKWLEWFNQEWKE